MKSPLSIVILAAACIAASLLVSCTVSLGLDGKPVVGVDSTSIVTAIKEWQASKAKDSNVEIVWEK
ncbi:MAG: hypothetical protein WCL11_22680 [Verrucomicrobiota bacterium]